MKTKLSLFKRIQFYFRQKRSDRNRKVLDTMTAFNMDEAIRLANKKRDICNFKVYVVGGAGEYVIFTRYQKKDLQHKGILQPHLTFKDLDEKACYIALPVTSNDWKRGGILRRYTETKVSPRMLNITRAGYIIKENETV